MKSKIKILKGLLVLGAFAATVPMSSRRSIMASAEGQTFNVTFHYVDKEYQQATEVVQVKENTMITNNLKYVQSAIGYNFDCWDKVGTRVTSDMDVYAHYSLQERTDDKHFVTRNDDMSYKMENLVGSPQFGAMLLTYNAYENFELEFTISNNETSFSKSRGPLLVFGDHLKYFLTSGYDASGTKRTGLFAQPEFAAMIYQNGAKSDTVIAGWYCAPMEATVKVTVQDNIFNVFVKSSDSEYVRPQYWPANVSLGNFSSAGVIGFGFTDGSTGTYKISNISIKNLDSETTLLETATARYNLSLNDPLSVNVTSSDEIQSVWFGNKALKANEYLITTEGGKQVISIEKDVVLENLKYAVDNKIDFTVYTSKAQFDVCELSFEGFGTHNIKFLDHGETIYELNVSTNERVVLPDAPIDSIGWYKNGKKQLDAVVYPFEDMVFDVKYATDMFNVTFVYRNLKFKEKTETLQFVYGTQITDSLYKIENPSGYIFTGWDYYGIVEEDITITASYSIYSKSNDFSLDFNGGLLNGNYVDYVSTVTSGGYTDLANNYMETCGILSGSMLFTNQKYIDFEMTFDIVKYSNAIFNDNNLVITFGASKKGIMNYYEREFSIVIGLESYQGQYISTAYLLSGKSLATAKLITPLCDAEKVSSGATFKNLPGFYDSGLSPDGKFVQLKLVKEEGVLSFYSKYNTETEWKKAFEYFAGNDVIGYLGYGVNTEHLYHAYNLGMDNFTVKNLDENNADAGMSIEDLEVDSSGVYQYKAGSKDLKTNVNFMMQPFNGINVVIYDENNQPVKELSIDIIREKIYEIGDFVTLNKRVLGQIYNQYSKNGKLRIDIVIILEVDWGKVSIDMTAANSVSVEYRSFGKTVETKQQVFGSKFVIPENLETPYGYKFVCWVDEDGNTLDGDYAVVDDMICTAKFEPFEFKIVFLDIDGNPFYTTTGRFGDDVVLPAIDPISLDGTKFLGWDIDDLTITGDMVIKSLWDKSDMKGCEGSIDTCIVSTLIVSALGITLISLKKKESKR